MPRLLSGCVTVRSTSTTRPKAEGNHRYDRVPGHRFCENLGGTPHAPTRRPTDRGRYVPAGGENKNRGRGVRARVGYSAARTAASAWRLAGGRTAALTSGAAWRTFFWLCGCGERGPGAGSHFTRSTALPPSRIRGRGSHSGLPAACHVCMAGSSSSAHACVAIRGWL